jgi:hypothetical protein
MHKAFTRQAVLIWEAVFGFEVFEKLQTGLLFCRVVIFAANYAGIAA